MSHPFVTKLKGKSPVVIFEAIFAEMVIPNRGQVIDSSVTSWSESAIQAQACRVFSVELVDGDGDVWMAYGELSMTMDTVQGHIVELELLIDDQPSKVVIDGEFEEQELMESCFK